MTKGLKSLMFENKTAVKQLGKVERKYEGTKSTLEKLMKERNLIKVNGKLEAKKDHLNMLQKLLKSADIPDYDKIKVRENPLEPVVKKLEEKGMTPAQAFGVLDEDEDEVLTKQEITDGLKMLEVDLLDTEWTDLMNTIDADGDGVLTMDEWENVLTPKINAQRDFIKIMKGLSINDPLVMEEQILDLVYKKRRLQKEVNVMRNTRDKEHFMRK